MTRIRLCLLLTAAALVAVPGWSRADIVTLTDGRQLEGETVVLENGDVELTTHYGSMTITKDQIVSIEEKPVPPKPERPKPEASPAAVDSPAATASPAASPEASPAASPEASPAASPAASPEASPADSPAEPTRRPVSDDPPFVLAYRATLAAAETSPAEARAALLELQAIVREGRLRTRALLEQLIESATVAEVVLGEEAATGFVALGQAFKTGLEQGTLDPTEVRQVHGDWLAGAEQATVIRNLQAIAKAQIRYLKEDLDEDGGPSFATSLAALQDLIGPELASGLTGNWRYSLAHGPGRWVCVANREGQPAAYAFAVDEAGEVVYQEGELALPERARLPDLPPVPTD